MLGKRWIMLAGAVGLAASTMVAGAAVVADADMDASGNRLSSITVQGLQQREAIQRQASAFVTAVAVRPWGRSLVRWNEPLCPLVAGLSRDQGEFVLARLSQIAMDAGASLAGATCRANFYVIVTVDPDSFIKEWLKRDSNLFGSGSGPSISRFVRSTQAVRVWYNANLNAADGSPLTQGGLALIANAVTSTGTAFNGVPTNLHAELSHLKWDETQALSSVLAIVDARYIGTRTLAQLTDYIGMTGLTEVRLNSDTGNTDTVLRLFDASDKAGVRVGLSLWDRAFLKALYHTDQTDKMQISTIQTAAARYISP